MIKGTEAYLQNNDRPKKRALQLDYYAKVAAFLQYKPIHVFDMPSKEVELSLDMMNASGIKLHTYSACEYDPEITKDIANDLQVLSKSDRFETSRLYTGDVLEVLERGQVRQRSGEIDFFNLDFCGAMGASWRSFMLPHLFNKLARNRFAICLTFSPRSPSRPVLKIDHTLRVVAPELYGLRLLRLEQNNYNDTSAMCSWLAFYEKETASERRMHSSTNTRNPKVYQEGNRPT